MKGKRKKKYWKSGEVDMSGKTPTLKFDYFLLNNADYPRVFQQSILALYKIFRIFGTFSDVTQFLF